MTETLVFDNTPLSHFARAGRLDTLEKLVAPYRCVTPAEVITESYNGLTEHPGLSKVLAAHWIQVVELVDINEVVAFARYKAELGGGMLKNNGEAAVLAWTSVHGGIAIVDERAGTRIGLKEGMTVQGTLWLVTNGLRSGKLDRIDAERIVDELAATDMALPVNGAGFIAWAYQDGLLP